MAVSHALMLGTDIHLRFLLSSQPGVFSPALLMDSSTPRGFFTHPPSSSSKRARRQQLTQQYREVVRCGLGPHGITSAIIGELQKELPDVPVKILEWHLITAFHSYHNQLVESGEEYLRSLRPRPVHGAQQTDTAPLKSRFSQT